MATKVSLAAKFEIDKFNRKNDFSLWRVKMHALLVQQGLWKALKGKDALPATLSDEEKEDLLEWAHSAIQLSLVDEVLRETVDEDTVAGLCRAQVGKSIHDQVSYKSLVYEATTIHNSNERRCTYF